MIIVTTMLYADTDHGANDSQPPTYWRASCALIDFGETESNILLSSMRERHASQEAAHTDMRCLALKTTENEVEMMKRRQSCGS